jgi:hypothetical protein
MSAARHDSSSMTEARTLREAGWSYRAIASLLTRRGSPVADTTVAEWCDPEKAARRRRRNLRRMAAANSQRNHGRLGAGPPRSMEFRDARMRSLRTAGLSMNAIAKVMTFDFPDEPWTEREVRDLLKDVAKGPRHA